MRFPALRHCLVSCLSLATWSTVAFAERSAASFPDDAEPAGRAPSRSEPTVVRQSAPPVAAPATPSMSRPERDGRPERDEGARTEERRRKQWMLSVEGVTHAPIDMGVQLGIETPQGLRLFGGYGWVPGAYMNLLTGIAANASGNSYAQALLDHSQYSGRTWRVQAGFRPLRAIGLYADVGYAHVSADGALDLASSGVPQLAMFGGGYAASTVLDMWLLELGYEGEIADRVVLALALGMMGTFDATTEIKSVGGAPTNNAVLTSVATQADSALEKYGFVPTLTLRLGFDLI